MVGGVRTSWLPAIHAASVVLLFAAALRWAWFGDPIAGLDEQFYLLAGDRLNRGALPYVDLWDRKPAGLFLLYAAVHYLPGDGVLAYQIVATLALAATGCVTAAIARHFAPRPASIAASLAVVGYGVLLGPGFGEPPIFHDLLTASAVWLLLPIAAGRDALARGIFAMLLCGLAITIKTNAVFEGIALGLVLVAAEWRRERALAALLPRLAAYLLAGAMPMLSIGAFYAAIGAFEPFWFANFISITRKSGGASTDALAGLVACFVLLAPLIGLAVLGIRRLPPPGRLLIVGWTAGCIASFAAIGFFAFHYALPLVTPLAILAAPALGRWGGRMVMAICALVAMASPFRTAVPAQDFADVMSLRQRIPSAVRTQCLFIYEGPTILYHLTAACLPGRYVFPGHFTDPQEADALERPSAQILRETLARAPVAILTVGGRAATPNDRILAAELARRYRLAATRSIRLYGTEREPAQLWLRR
jgi:hypothetical protein